MNYYFILTDACSYHCDFCIRNNISATLTGHMDYYAFCNVAESLHHKDPNCIVTLTGGEPTLHPRFKDIIKKAATVFDRVCVTSNGAFNDDMALFLASLMKKNVYIQISIDGPQKIHNKLRGELAFEKAVHNIILLNEVYDHVIISTTVGKKSLEHIKELAEYLNNIKFHHWKVSQEQLAQPSKNTIIPPEEWNSFVDELLPLCRYRVTIKKMFAFDIWKRHLEQNCPDETFNNNCGLGRNKIYITPKMDAIPCTCMEHKCGNLLTDGWQGVFDKMEAIGDITPDEQSVCYTCQYKKICNGGCPGYSIKIFGKLNMGDIRCPLIKEK